MSLRQQRKLYRAEKHMWGHGREFSNDYEVLLYLSSLTESDWFINRFGYVPAINVIPFNSSKWAGAANKNKFTIYINRRVEHVVLHEVAHLLCMTDEHDELFVDIYQYLIRHAMGFFSWAEFMFELKKEEFYVE